MLVNRRAFQVKKGCMQEVVDMLVENRDPNDPYRIYVPKIGHFDVVAFEIEVENLEAYEKGWAEWEARPETAAFMEKWNELTEIGGINEIWTLV